MAISIGILLFDIFFQSEFFSYLGIFLFASYFNGLFEQFLPIQWSIVTFVFFFLIGIFLYYTIWRRFISPFVLGLFLRNATKEPIDSAINQIGIFRNIDGVQFVEWNGELWNATGDILSDNDKVKILDIESGIVKYKKLEK